MKYVIITPAKNEEKLIKFILSSVVNQTIRPSKWIIVDDNSNDKTYEIVKDYARDYDWIKITKCSINNKRAEGAPIIKAFYVGYELIKNDDWDFIVKLDADLTLPKDYFETVINCFRQNNDVGMAGGYCETIVNGIMKREHNATYHIRGPMKSIRRECWEDIGGFKAVLGWDGLDEMMAMYHNWKTKNIDKKVIHHRPTTSDYDQRSHAYLEGYSKYKNGSNVTLIILRALRRLSKKPRIIYSLYFLSGYFKAMMNKESKNVTPELEKFINKFHLERIKNLDF